MQRGLEERHVVAHYLRNCLSSLQDQSHPAWQVTLPGDTTRLAPNRGVADPELRVRMNCLVGEAPEARSDSIARLVVPVGSSPQLSFVLAEMPHCNEWGLIPEEDELGALPGPPLSPPPHRGLRPRGPCDFLK